MPNQRVHSLDILRTLGLFAVLIWHSPKTLHHFFGPVGALGWQGVDLFFILSGYLIAAQVFEAFNDGHPFSITKFYIRRGLRTLPVYWVMLALYFLVPILKTSNDTPELWKYLTFTVNFDQRQGITFGHVWTLCVEEQFYLIFPLVAFFILPKRRWKLGFSILIAVFLSGMLIRGYLWIHYVEGHPDWYARFMRYLYFPTWSRLDGIVLGIGIAALKAFKPQQWEFVTRRGNWYLALAIVLFSISMPIFLDGTNFISTTFAYPISCLGYTCLVMAALSRNSYLTQIYIPGAQSIAIWSYSAYLVHLSVFNLTFDTMSRQFAISPGFFSLSVALAITFALAALSYKFIERPFLKMRAKYV